MRFFEKRILSAISSNFYTQIISCKRSLKKRRTRHIVYSNLHVYYAILPTAGQISLFIFYAKRIQNMFYRFTLQRKLNLGEQSAF